MECSCKWKDGEIIECCGAHILYIRALLTKALKDVETMAKAELALAEESVKLFLKSKDLSAEKEAAKHLIGATAMRAAIELFKNSFGVAVYEDTKPKK